MFIAIADKSQIASSRRSAESLARSLGFDETRTGRVAIIATEMMTNILKHATHGHLLVRRFTDGTSGGVEVMAMDKGPGIGDIAHAIEDAYSTVGTPGTGLGAIRRQADIFDIYSRPGAGTVLMARVLTEYSPLRHAVPEFELGVALAPYPGQPESGDSWAFGIKSGAPSLFAVDGLAIGHPLFQLRAAPSRLSRKAIRWTASGSWKPSIAPSLRRAVPLSRWRVSTGRHISSAFPGSAISPRLLSPRARPSGWSP
jgi:anti-sigma regulatory factor (Ser/Thr protein kinase)